MRGNLIGALIVLGLVVIGCEKEESATAPPAGGGTVAGERASDATRQAGAAMDAGAKDAADTADAAKKEAAGAIEGTKAAGAEATSAIQGEAQKLLDQALQYVKDNKLDLAEQTLVKLEGMKAQLPETMQKGIAQARSALDTAKNADKAKGMLGR